MIGNGVKIQRRTQLNLIPTGVSDCLTFGIAIGIVGCGRGAKVIGIKGVLSVHVQVAEVGIAVRVGRRYRPVQQVSYRLQLRIGIVYAPSAKVVGLL